MKAVEDALDHYSLGGGDNVQAALEALRELLDTDKVILYSLAQSRVSDDLEVTRAATVRYPRDQWRKVFDEFLRGRGVSLGAYNPLHPELAQRDRVLRSDERAVLTNGRSLVVEQEVARRLGMPGEDMMRALVCDGPSMLAFLGMVQPEATTPRQRRLLTRLLPAFRRRLRFERQLAESALSSSALAAVLDEINGAAWVLGPTGAITFANAAGRARLDAGGIATRRAVEAGPPGPDPSRYRVMGLRDAKGAGGRIVVEIPDETSRPLARDAALRFGLTPAQTRVLASVVRGVSNATIAAELGVAERTIEAHVTAILVKAQVPSRAALIVQIFGRR